MKKNIPALILLSSWVVSASEPKTFKGKLTESLYPELIGRECSITLEQEVGFDSGEIRFMVYPQISGLKYKTHRKKAPMMKMRVNNYLAQNVSSKPNILIGGGSKFRYEVSQMISLQMDSSMQIPLEWSYIDGTSTLFGSTYKCQIDVNTQDIDSSLSL